MGNKLTAEEQDIEDNFDDLVPASNEELLMNSIISAAKAHTKMRKLITIRVPINDIEIIKIKASKLGIPYQTYINMLIHQDTVRL